MPAMPSSLLEPLWQQFSASLPERSEFDPAHPLGHHRRRVPDETVFRLVVEASAAVPPRPDGSIALTARAWAVSGRKPVPAQAG